MTDLDRKRRDSARQRFRRKEHPESIRESKRRYRQGHIESERAYARSWYHKNAKRILSRLRNKYLADPSKKRIASAKYRIEHRESALQTVREWRSKNAAKVQQANRRVVQQMPDCYIRVLFHNHGQFVDIDPSQELIDFIRRTLSYKRRIREVLNERA